MVSLYVILFLLLISSCHKLDNEETWNVDYISKNTSNVVKGVCIWIVFICHISSYLNKIPQLPYSDVLLFVANGYVKQLLVVPFLFYSGYGVTYSIMNKREEYVRRIPYSRCLPTLLNFDVAVIIFLIIDLTIGRHFNLQTIILSLLAWDSIGNSNWYIFCILICYLISWTSARLSGINSKMIYLICFFILLYTLIMEKYSEGSWWYDSAYSYAAGAVFAWKKDYFIQIIRKHFTTFAIISFIGFLICYNLPDYYGVFPNLSGVFLCLLIVIFTNKIKLRSSILEWSGRHLFPLYIYQRIPMLVLSSIFEGAFIENHRYIYVFLCIIITILFTSIYKYIEIDFKNSFKSCRKSM